MFLAKIRCFYCSSKRKAVEAFDDVTKLAAQNQLHKSATLHFFPTFCYLSNICKITRKQLDHLPAEDAAATCTYSKEFQFKAFLEGQKLFLPRYKKTHNSQFEKKTFFTPIWLGSVFAAEF